MREECEMKTWDENKKKGIWDGTIEWKYDNLNKHWHIIKEYEMVMRSENMIMTCKNEMEVWNRNLTMQDGIIR